MPAAANGHSALILPTSTSEYHAMVNALRAHHSGMHGQASDIAANLRNILPDVIAARGGGKTGLIGLDNKLAAYKVVRPLMDAAALNQKLAKLYVVSYTRYIEYVVNAKTNPTTSKFNADA